MSSDPRFSDAVVRALLDGSLTSNEPTVNAAHALLGVFGYDFRNAAHVARANDQLVRSRAAELLGQAEAALIALEARFRQAYIPPSTREHPFPPDNAMKALRRLDALRRRVADVASVLLTLEVPATDRIWSRLQQEHALLERVLAADIGLVGGAHEVHDAALALTTAAVEQQQLGSVEGPLAAVDASLAARRELRQEQGGG